MAKLPNLKTIFGLSGHKGAPSERATFKLALSTAETERGQPETIFKEIVKIISPILKLSGYSKHGTKFRKMIEGNVTIIQFQRSRYNNPGSIKFTLNTSIVSARIYKLWGGDTDIARVSEWHGQLRQRIGSYAETPSDLWWYIEPDTDPTQIAAEVLRLLNLAISYLDQHASDEALVALWKSGRAPGITEQLRINYLALANDSRRNL